VKIKRDEEHGNIGFDFDSLFDDPQNTERVPDRPEWAKKDKLAFEREMLGLYVSDHPLAGLETALAKHASTSIADLMASEHTQDGDTVTIAGLITSVQHRVAKKSGNQYGMIQVEDFGGEITVLFMGKAYLEFSPALIGDSIVVVRGRVSLRDDGMNLHAFNLTTPDLGQDLAAGPLTIQLADDRATAGTVTTLSEILSRHTGDSEVRLRLIKGRTARVFEVPRPVKVSADLYGELKGLLGPHCLG
jgi:DNA polymerase III subunit alpha